MTGGKLACVVPALDADNTLGGVIRRAREALPGATVIAVDDGSTDRTRAVAHETADVVIGFERNRGKGAALRAGFAAALDAGCEIVLTIDADGQHDVAFAPALLDAVAAADMAIGARPRAGSPMPLHRRVSNAVSSAAISWCAGCTLPDSQSGFRAIRASVLHRVRPVGERYEFETEFLILAARAGFRLVSVPVPTIYGGVSHFRPVRDAGLVIRSIWRHRRGGVR